MSRKALDIFTILIFFISLHCSSYCSSPASAHSNKQFKLLKDVRSLKHNLSQLYHLDKARLSRRRLDQQSPSPSAAVAQFMVENDSMHNGLYYTKVSLGSPPKELFVQIDTAVSDMWVSCSSCNGCPQTGNFYDASKSSTSYLISCSDMWCQRGAPNTCAMEQQIQCTYSLNYRVFTGAELSGYYVSDVIHLDTNGTSDTSPTVHFGCTTFMTQSFMGIEGNLGLGKSGHSLISQLHDQGDAPKVFFHCLSGSDGESGAGILVLGHPQGQNVVYTPLVDTWLGYYINLKSISVDGQTLAIDPSTFALLDRVGGTQIDSGYNLAYLPADAYFSFVEAVTKLVSHSVQPHLINGRHCYLSTSSVLYSVLDKFPMISLNFEGDASMHLRPKDYLIQDYLEGESEVWCIGFMESTHGNTVLGDLVLKDKLIVYDLEAERLGWTNYDCSSYINATSTVSSDAPCVILGWVLWVIIVVWHVFVI
ncbi:aspartic proteinase-like protein 2 [Artemisia annua]|uniref:Aspartic proteinase-like protein 2 n=1 Tax=Artemisia annua TaxID=35608 RepID=A0A2U1NYU0_ARTAN|nr:aspartic proteinase-like protein 2 [Artemisia annua]